MRETLSTLTLILWLFVFIAAVSLPLIVWRCKDLLLEIRDHLKAMRTAPAGTERPPSTRG